MEFRGSAACALSPGSEVELKCEHCLSLLQHKQVTMKTLILFLLAVSGHRTTAVIHSFKGFQMAASGIPNFPEFVVVGLVNQVQVIYFDSNTKRIKPKQEWQARVAKDDGFLKWLSDLYLDYQHVAKARVDVFKQRFNQSGGAHIVQQMYGCEWDDETDEVKGFDQFGYDGEDFIVLDLETETWIAPRPQALVIKYKWDNDKVKTETLKHRLTWICSEQLKKYVNYGRKYLLRTELPSVSVLQKTSSSPIICHATGFYPARALLFWRKDGEELHEDMDLGEILPNHDGTFQMSVDLKLSVPPEDHHRYECVFQFSAVKEDVVTRMDDIRTNREKSTVTIVIIAAMAVVAVVLAAGIGFMVYRKKKSNCPECQDDADKNSELSKKLSENPENE